MERHFEKELESLKENLTTMGSLVDDQLDKACQALFNGDLDTAAWVMQRDTEVDAFDNRIDLDCQRIFALAQPVANDLRLLMASLNINSQLERIGDIAVNIAERVEPLRDHLDFLKSTKVFEMAEVARIMVKDSLESFMYFDAELAQRVLVSDDVVDGINRTLFRTLVEEMQAREERVEAGAHILLLSRHLERVADHATNIAEGVVFVVEAKTVKHHARELGEES
jgi:phosphate transport system protein